MIVVQFAAEIRKELRERMNEIADTLATGGAKSFEQYQGLCGEIRGLAIAERALLDAAERVEKTNV
jgi:hypothetical protein